MQSSNADILKQRVLSVDESNFDSLALDIFQFQATNNPVYRQYIEQLGKKLLILLQLVTFLFCQSNFSNPILSLPTKYQAKLFLKVAEPQAHKPVVIMYMTQIFM
jgi:hypothetical protein